MTAEEKRERVQRILRELLITSLILGASFLLATLSTFMLQAGDFRLAVFSAISSLILVAIGGFYIVPKLARRINLRLFSLKFPYSATTETAFFLVITIIVGFSAVNTGNNLLYLVFSVMLAVLLSSGIISEASLRGIDVSLRFPEHIFASQETMLDLTLINRKAITPSFSVTVGVLSDIEEEFRAEGIGQRVRHFLMGPELAKGLRKLAHFSILPGNSRMSQKISYTFPRRGSYLITGFTVSTKFPFGFLRKTHERDALGEILVYPRMQPFSCFSATLPILSGVIESIERGMSSDLYMIRPYQFRDNLRYIAWKATAKTRQLMVKEFTREDERRITVILDNNIDLKDEDKFEKAVEIVASLLEHFTAQGAELRLLTPLEQTEFDTGQDHFYKMLKILTFIQPASEERGGLEPLLGDDRNDYKLVFTCQQVMDGQDIRVVDLKAL